MIFNIVYINKLNDNDRIYDLEACEKIIEDFKNKHICYGCIENMEYSNIKTLSKISHVVENMWI